MQRKPPLPLLVIAAVCIATEVTFLLLQSKALGLIRVALHSLLLILIIRGRRGAAEFWAFLSIVGGVLTGFNALKLAPTHLLTAAILAAYAAFLLLSVAYVLRSRTMVEYFATHAEVEDAA